MRFFLNFDVEICIVVLMDYQETLWLMWKITSFSRNCNYLIISVLLSRMLIDLIFHLIDNSNTFAW